MENLLSTVLRGEQGEIKLAGSEGIRYGVYEEKGVTTVYLLNTDFEVPQQAKVYFNEEVFPVTVPETELRIIYSTPDIILSPEGKEIHLNEVRKKKNLIELEFKGRGRQTLEIKSRGKPFTSFLWNSKEIKYQYDKERHIYILKFNIREKGILIVKI